MFVGHFAPAMAAAVHKDAPSLPTLFIAGQLVDWAFFGFLLTGTEQMRLSPGITAMNPMDLFHMPYTHSLVGAMAWAAGFGILIFFLTKNRTAALIGAAVVLSHWFLDLLVHGPDLTIAGNAPKLGFGLWNYPAIEMPLEIAITLGALWFYAQRRASPLIPTVVLAATLMLLQCVNWFGPVPTEVDASMSLLAFVGFGLATLAAWWVSPRSLPRSIQSTRG